MPFILLCHMMFYPVLAAGGKNFFFSAEPDLCDRTKILQVENCPII